jgi:uncharacterized damage-inducible protein DinB
MNKTHFIEVAQYNIWANNIAITWLEAINDEQWNREIVSSFNSIAKTCIHIAGAEKIWLERWIESKDIAFLSNTFDGSKTDLITIWQEASKNILSFVAQVDEGKLHTQFSLTRLNGESNTIMYGHSIAHVLNHSTYHRGQLVTMLRQVGFTKVSSTDMSGYFPK